MLAPSYPTIPQAVAALEEEADESPARVAELLARAEVHGICGDPARCAIAQWLDLVTPAVDQGGPYNIMVSPADDPGDGYIRWESTGHEGVLVRDEIPLPYALNEFAALFDERRYPELVAACDAELLRRVH